jgi:hypothetical protein
MMKFSRKRWIEPGEFAVFCLYDTDDLDVVFVVDRKDGELYNNLVTFKLQDFHLYTVMYEGKLYDQVERQELFVDDEEISKGVFASSFL